MKKYKTEIILTIVIFIISIAATVMQNDAANRLEEQNRIAFEIMEMQNEE